MILENFYTIKSKQISEDQINYTFEIIINNKHDIFRGHFPDNPVMPGVCMIQIIKEITESVIGKKLFMDKCSNVKFLAIINPDKTPKLTLELQITKIDSKVKVKNTTKFEDTVALKLSAQYQILV
ncbi:MAG: 3-hydroxyacyl-ACP dehydratase [Flavobacteriaceae bacterium]|nr:3-hydroxyacyl-ACP dehydratase [Flavobacteriaceae bacterium]